MVIITEERRFSRGDRGAFGRLDAGTKLRMMNFSRLTFFTAFLILLTGCSGKKKRDSDLGPGYVEPLTVTETQPTGESAAAAPTVGQLKVQELERSGSKLDRWFLNAQSGKRLRSREAMFEVISPLHSGSDPALDTLAFLFQSASVVSHFTFESNYNAMVFFDESGNPIHVEKW